MATTKLLMTTSFLCFIVPLGICAQNSGSATLNINLYPVQTIEVTTTGIGIDLDYRTGEDYKNGVNTTAPDHLKIYSTGGFAIKVRSASPELSNTMNQSSSISPRDISITATKGTTYGTENFKSAKVQLSTADSELITSTVGVVNRTFNINYQAKGNDAYINKFLKAQDPTVYSTEVVYIIEPQ